MRRFLVLEFKSKYFPEGHPRYSAANRADRLYPGQRVDNNNENQVNQDVAASEVSEDEV